MPIAMSHTFGAAMLPGSQGTLYVEDWSGFTVGQDPDDSSDWSFIQNSPGHDIQVVAADAVFGTQHIIFDAPNGAGTSIRQWDLPGAFTNGTVKAQFYLPSLGTNVQPCVAARLLAADPANNHLVLRYVETLGEIRCYETIGGVTNNIGDQVAVTVAANTIYTLIMTFTGTAISFWLKDATETTTLGSGTATTTGASAGKAGLYKVSVDGSPDIHMDNNQCLVVS